jgi:hypothetical protein
MTARGPVPNPNRRRRNIDETPKTLIGGPVDAPDLPDAESFSEATRRWYATWAGSEQAVAFLATDWQRLHMLAHVVERFFVEGKTSDMAEIRLNEQQLGATIADRLRARMVLEDEAKAKPKPAAGSDPRARLRALSDAS